MASKKRAVVQTKNPRSGHYVKIDRSKAKHQGQSGITLPRVP